MGHLNASNKCEGSGEFVEPSVVDRYTTCPTCGRTGVKVNANRRLREHSKVGNHRMVG